MRALIAIARLGRPVSGRLGIAVLLGLGAALAGIGLTATSAWLISRAAQQPPVLYLMIAITAVQAFGVSRGVLRYGERLAAHDAAFGVLARLRGQVYLRLERLAPAGLAAYRSGDLLARLVADVDGLADLWLRVLLPYIIVVFAATATTLLVGALVPVAGLVLGATLFLVAFVVPLVAGALGRAAERRLAPARGALAAAVTDLLAGAPELQATGAMGPHLDALSHLDGALRAAERRAGTAVGLGALAAGLAAGAATWFALVAGVGALRSGALDAVALAVVVLTPTAVHELAAGLVPAAQHLPGLAAAAERVQEVLRQPDPVIEPDVPAVLPAGPYGLRLTRVGARYGDGPLVLDDVDLDLAAGGGRSSADPAGAARARWRPSCSASWTPSRGRSSSSRRRGPVMCAGLPATTYGASSSPARRTPMSSTPRSATTCGSRARMRPTTRSGTPCGRRASPTGSTRCPTAWPRGWASTGPASPAASSSVWPWPGPYWRMRRC